MNSLIKSAFLIFHIFVVLSAFPPQSAYGVQEDDNDGCLIVTGHILNKKAGGGINQEFLENAIVFINKSHPDFLILTGDMVFGEKEKSGARLSVDAVRRRYELLIHNVFDRVETKIYCVAGNHDTGWIPHPPSIEIFEKLLNPLYFSFEHKGSLFLFLSPYQPFPHTEKGGVFPLKKYDTPASQEFLRSLRSKFKRKHNHIFIFTHFSPVNDFPIGYYWSHFLIPLLSTLKQDVHVFSTNHGTRKPLIRETDSVVRHKNIRFYCFAEFQKGSYIIHFGKRNVKVDLLRGCSFSPSLMREVFFQPATRLSMLQRYISFWFMDYPRWIVTYYSFKYFGKGPKDVLKYYYHRIVKKVRSPLDKFLYLEHNLGVGIKTE